MTRQIQRYRSVSKPAEHIDERPERTDHAEEAECCLADIDAVIEEACCLLDAAADMLSPAEPVVEAAPSEKEFTAERNRLKSIYYDMPYGTAAKDEAWAAVEAYENKWPQHTHLCVC